MIFLDTGYILALANSADKYHAVALQAASSIRPPFLTTDAVLIELGNALSRRPSRTLAMETVNDLRSDPNIEIVSVDRALFEDAWTLFCSRDDKDWSVTDCMSFVVMQERGISEVATTDRHFTQAGFTNLLEP
jgi:hypothetical protein